MLEKFLDLFVSISTCEQCSQTSSISTLRSYCYLKDLKQVSYVCCNLPYGKEDQTLLIDDEPCKVF
jgi:hypothetical protein